MKKNRYRPSTSDELNAERAKRMRRVEAYLTATQAEFEAAVARASKLSPDIAGVLAGPRGRVRKDVQ